MAQNNYYLMHHGVKGMKWGVRRTPEQLGYKRAQKGGVDERYVNRAVRQAYALDRKTNKSARQSKRQMRIEEELETYINTNRSGVKDAALIKAIAREENRKPSAVQAKLSDPEFKRKAATAAKVALVIGAAYATHKVINDPKVLAAGKDAITKVVAKSGAVKASTIKNVMNSTEFKAAKALASKSGAITDTAKTVGGAAGKVLKKIGSEETRNTITGIGLMAGTASVLVTGKGYYAGTKIVTFKIAKADNPMSVIGKTVSVKLKKVKKRAQAIAIKAAIDIRDAVGNITFKKVSGNKKIAVSKTGKVTVKKGLKKGVYRVKVSVVASGNANYADATKAVMFKIRIK